MRNWVVAVVIFIIGVFAFNAFKGETAPGANADVAVSGLVPACEIGVPVSGIVAVAGDTTVYSGPSETSDAVVNAKATAALGSTHLQSIDQSQTVRRLCEENDWTQMSVVTPEWLTHVNGWVPSSALRQIERTASGQRVYTDADFGWYDDTRPYADQIVAVVNQITRENKNCETVDTGTVSLSPSRSSASDPVFFITCGTGAAAFNVWFRPDDAKADTSFAAIQPLDQTRATSMCQSAAASAANHPSTVSFDLFSTSYSAHPSGRASVQSKFKATNGFNLELAFNIRCLFEGAALIETSIWEEGA